MPKTFNTTAVCLPEKHYMVDITNRIEEIREYVENGKYFTINRARQYGKTTTLAALRKALVSEYVVISLDFQGIGNAGFKTEQTFVQELARLILGKTRSGLSIPESIEEQLKGYVARTEKKAKLGELFDTFTEWCAISEKEIVLIIDEVDSATNNQVFLDFLAQLREGYIRRDTEGVKTFKSVILAGVTDVKHLKSKLRNEDQHKVNSPWNIAADFDVDIIRNNNGTVVISNRIFETFLYNLFLSEEIMKSNIFVRESGLAKNMFVEGNRLNMPLILERFIATYTEVFGLLEEKFKEKDGREQFLLYLKPIINGTGNYYIEAQTRDQTRTDVIVDYLGQRYIIELKVWHSDSYNKAGEEQLTGYLDYFGEKTGYMLSFNFNKKKKKQGIRRIEYKDKVLFEAML